MAGVIGRFATAAENKIIAGALALEAQAAKRQPAERIQPKERCDDARKSLGEAVPSFNVREFMQQNDPPPFLRPLIGFGRQQNHGTPYPPR